MTFRISERRKRKAILFPQEASARQNKEKELDSALDRVVTKFAEVEGWAIAGGDAVRINTGGNYHRILEEIEMVIYAEALPQLIAHAEKNPRPYTLLSRQWMLNASPNHQVETYHRVDPSEILSEINQLKAKGLPRDKKGIVQRIKYRNLRLVEESCLDKKHATLTRDNSIDLSVIYGAESEKGHQYPVIVCPDAKAIIPSSDFYMNSFPLYPSSVTPHREYTFSVVCTPFLIEKCRANTSRNKHVLTYDRGILETYGQKVK